jgi:phosphatidylglycerophosphatase A
MGEKLKLWIAQGFGVGRIPFAPGTFGSLVGLLWFALLLLPGRFYFFAIGTVTGVAVSVWLTDEAERILHAKDPGSVVLDEIVALPICFLSWLCVLYVKIGTLPKPEDFFVAERWKLTAMIFVAFRLLDIAKPWPVRQSQNLRGGWGVTMDDVLAAVYVNLLVLFVYSFQ